MLLAFLLLIAKDAWSVFRFKRQNPLKGFFKIKKRV
ncbi:hypothetical protein N871_04970 [Helicobacter pylori X47-2AL]|uniref:Uncharacterized protein n=1 Tax=Helicobacter pylori X47-2AL TaxID=1386083 RepID=V6L7G2_HELPX|nr:hypothetical protein N871_04970 [Helicobacter pylori X47-2AL]